MKKKGKKSTKKKSAKSEVDVAREKESSDVVMPKGPDGRALS